MDDYCRRIDVERTYLGFQPVKHIGFDIKNIVLVGLRDNQFDESKFGPMGTFDTILRHALYVNQNG